VTDITVFLQNDDFSNQFDDSSSQFSNQFDDSSSQISILIFENLRRKEINDLLKRRVFELIIIENVLRNVRIFNFRFVDEIKHSNTSDAYEKSRTVIQTYNDQDKTLIFIQFLIIQRMSQWIIFALTACIISQCHLYSKDITQAHVQSEISLNREFFIRSLFELDLSEKSTLKIIKSLYDVSETETHWFNTY
jgi:hypothetical protein